MRRIPAGRGRSESAPGPWPDDLQERDSDTPVVVMVLPVVCISHTDGEWCHCGKTYYESLCWEVLLRYDTEHPCLGRIIEPDGLGE